MSTRIEHGREPVPLLVATALCALATIGLGLMIVLVFPATAELTRGFRTPTLAFEFAQSEEDLRFLSGTSTAAARLRAQMDAGHHWDMAFPFAYGGLLTLLLVRLAYLRERLMWLGVPFALVAIPADIRENFVLLAITATLEQGRSAASLLPVLHVATWTKWGALGVAIGFLAIGLLRRGRRLVGTLGALGSAAIGLTWLTDSHGPIAEAMTVVVFVFFLAAAIGSLAAAFHAISAAKTR